jgi:hypothetical protein
MPTYLFRFLSAIQSVAIYHRALTGWLSSSGSYERWLRLIGSIAWQPPYCAVVNVITYGLTVNHRLESAHAGSKKAIFDQIEASRVKTS